MTAVILLQGVSHRSSHLVAGSRRDDPFFRDFVEGPPAQTRVEPVTTVGTPQGSKIDVRKTLQGAVLGAQKSSKKQWTGPLPLPLPLIARYSTTACAETDVMRAGTMHALGRHVLP